MKLRIGDLVTFKEEEGRKQTGFVTALTALYLLSGAVEVTIKRNDLRNLVNKKSIIGIVPRERVREYWKHL